MRLRSFSPAATRPLRHGRQHGGSVAELALSLPLLLLVMIGGIDFGRMWTISTRMANAAYSGAAYGAQTTETAKDSTGIAEVVKDALGVHDSESQALVVSSGGDYAPSYEISVERYCECEDESSVNCDTGVCTFGSGSRRTYVRVRVDTVFNTIFDYPGIPAGIEIARQSQLRAR